jgi:hypothetical protein
MAKAMRASPMFHGSKRIIFVEADMVRETPE